jgi:hypothetical protein
MSAPNPFGRSIQGKMNLLLQATLATAGFSLVPVAPAFAQATLQLDATVPPTLPKN